MKCNKCNEEVTMCENCGMQFDKRGMSIYCLVVKEGSTIIFKDENVVNKKKHLHHHYCSGECIKVSGGNIGEADDAESYD